MAAQDPRTKFKTTDYEKQEQEYFVEFVKRLLHE